MGVEGVCGVQVGVVGGGVVVGVGVVVVREVFGWDRAGWAGRGLGGEAV